MALQQQESVTVKGQVVIPVLDGYSGGHVNAEGLCRTCPPLTWALGESSLWRHKSGRADFAASQLQDLEEQALHITQKIQ